MESKSKNKNSWIIVMITVAVVTVGLVMGGMGIMNYYNDRYVATTYYARVPTDAVVTVDILLDDSGQPAATGHEYYLTGYNEAGETTAVSFSVLADSETDLYAPGTYIKAEVSSTIVVKQEVIAEGNVPAAIFPYLQ